MSKESWADEQAARIGQTIKALRGKRSGQWLSDTTAEVGHRVSRTTISEIENGKRKSVSTAELAVLAEALEVPPMYLLYPNLPDGEVEILPGQLRTSTEAWEWFAGERDKRDNQISRLIAASRLRGNLKTWLSEYENDSAGAPMATQKRIASMVEAIENTEKMIVDSGGTLSSDGR